MQVHIRVRLAIRLDEVQRQQTKEKAESTWRHRTADEVRRTMLLAETCNMEHNLVRMCHIGLEQKLQRSDCCPTPGQSMALHSNANITVLLVRGSLERKLACITAKPFSSSFTSSSSSGQTFMQDTTAICVQAFCCKVLVGDSWHKGGYHLGHCMQAGIELSDEEGDLDPFEDDLAVRGKGGRKTGGRQTGTADAAASAQQLQQVRFWRQYSKHCIILAGYPPNKTFENWLQQDMCELAPEQIYR